MKPYLNYFASAAACIVVIACSNTGVQPEKEIEKLPFTLLSGSAQRIKDPAPEDKIAEQAVSINEFAVALYKKLAKSDENLFFSPYSIVSALGMTNAGARENTDVEMREALKVTLPGSEFHAAMNSIDNALLEHANATDGVTLRIVNHTWNQINMSFNLSYLDVLSKYYGAGLNLLDFKSDPENCRQIINTWVEEQTNDKITNLIPEGNITPFTRMVLTNAIYFLGDWLHKFDKSKTSNEQFYLLNNTTVSAPLMYFWSGSEQERIKMLYAGNQTKKVRVLDIPYRGERLMMTVFLPDSGSFESFESNLSYENIAALIDEMDSTMLPPVRLPKFKYTSNAISLKEPLIELGMKDAFSSVDADFTGITTQEDLFISNVLHKAFIEVDEDGTEAAAATAVIMATTSMPIYPKMFVADRPFMYIIRDKVTNTILFMGKIVDPTKS